jgi:hypothetical protein
VRNQIAFMAMTGRLFHPNGGAPLQIGVSYYTLTRDWDWSRKAIDRPTPDDANSRSVYQFSYRQLDDGRVGCDGMKHLMSLKWAAGAARPYRSTIRARDRADQRPYGQGLSRPRRLLRLAAAADLARR